MAADRKIDLPASITENLRQCTQLVDAEYTRWHQDAAGIVAACIGAGAAGGAALGAATGPGAAIGAAGGALAGGAICAAATAYQEYKLPTRYEATAACLDDVLKFVMPSTNDSFSKGR